MDKLTSYRQIVLDVLDRYATWKPANKAIDTYKVIDRENDHFQLMHDGWTDRRRYYGCVLHFDIRQGKIWIQHNGTERDVAAELMERGVAREDIVLGFQAPSLRKYTEFAEA